MNKLLSDEELREEIRSILYVKAGQSQIPEIYVDEYIKSGNEAVYSLIDTQKRLYAESVVGDKPTDSGCMYCVEDIVLWEKQRMRIMPKYVSTMH